MKMKNIVMVGLLIGILFVVPNSEAAIQLSQQFDCPRGETLSIQNAGLLGVISSGQTIICISVADHVSRIGDTASVALTAVGPALSTLAISGNGGFLGTFNGCTFNGPGAGTLPTNPLSSPGFGGQDLTLSLIGTDAIVNQWGTLTITGTTCSGLLRATACLAIGTGPCFVNNTVPASTDILYNIVIAITIRTDDSRSQVMVTNCGSTGTGEINLLQSTNCGVPFTNSQNLNMNVECGATLGNFTALTNATNCTVPAFTATLAGTLQLGNITISSWPTLLANVTNSGAINVTNGGGQNIIVSGMLTTNMTGNLNVTMPNGLNVTITSWPQLQALLSGSVGVNNTGTLALTGNIGVINSGGQNITITSWPQLSALLNITHWPDSLNVTSSCGNTNSTPCFDNTTGSFNFTGNITQNVTNPPDFRSTAAYTQALWTLVLFLLAIGMAEWKKDLFYHLIAVIIGIYGIVTIPSVLGVERMVILGIMLYQIMRIVRIYQTPRNDLQRPETGTDI